ncbi:MAG TPA: hypothetical protein VL492_11720 [Methylovirgula sp.]|jgi:hypothetical protein|nr:hypothetical protein [Methylovirgula sp.]
MLPLTWIKCGDGNNWCSLERVNLREVRTTGVYFIWYEGDRPRAVHVGQGDIASQLQAHKRNPDILYYRRFGTLRVTWAAVAAAHLDGVERYLANYFQPLVEDPHPMAFPIVVRLP